jgi:hypothetical protein
MNEQDAKPFAELIASVYDFAGRPASKQTVGIWWNAMQAFDLEAVRKAFSLHTIDPDRGQFLPKPADIVRIIGGGSADAALIAWAKVEKAIRVIGPWKDVVFDDALIHAAIENLGGWVKVCGSSEKELPFVGNQFATLYRGYRSRGEVPAYCGVLTGEANGHNRMQGMKLLPAKFVGDPAQCERVAAIGSSGSAIAITSAADVARKALEHRA